jgi:hypothetical protein
MEDLKNKTFLLKVPTELFEYLNSQNSNEEVGKLYLNQKRSKPEYIFKFSKKKDPKKFALSFDKTIDFFYFYLNEKKDESKINNIDNFGKLGFKEEEVANELIKNIFDREKNNVKTIQIKEVKDKEKRYLNQDEIQLTGKIPGNKKEKKIRIEEDKVIEIVKKEVKNDNFITPKQISDIYGISEAQVKEIMDRICDKFDGGNRKNYYQLKDEIEL